MKSSSNNNFLRIQLTIHLKKQQQEEEEAQVEEQL